MPYRINPETKEPVTMAYNKPSLGISALVNIVEGVAFFVAMVLASLYYALFA